MLLMSISFFLDILDVALAILENPTLFGGILDIFYDHIVDISIILAIVSINIKELS